MSDGESEGTHREVMMMFLNSKPKEKMTKQKGTFRMRDNCLIEGYPTMKFQMWSNQGILDSWVISDHVLNGSLVIQKILSSYIGSIEVVMVGH